MVDIPDPFAPGAGTQDGSSFEWLEKFTKSSLESIPELIGITPSTETQQFRQDNPVSSFIGDMAGMAVPYMGWFKATKYLTRFDKAIEGLGNVSKPFAQGAIQEAARFAPFEAGRLAVSQMVGDKPFSEMLGETSLNLALGSGIGGLLHGVAAAGVRDPGLATLFPGIDVAAPLPLQARHMKGIIDSGQLQGEMLDRANYKYLNTLNAARTEELGPGHKYVAPIDYLPDANNTQLQHQLNRLFRTREAPDEKIIQVRKFAEGVEKDFPNQAAWTTAAEQGGLGPGFEDKGQFFRHISFNTTPERVVGASKSAQTIDSQLTRNMESVGDGAFMTREADDGMFVIARKVAGEPGKGTPGDQWVLFKTDQPGTFVPDAQRWANTMVAAQHWNPTAIIAEDGGVAYNAMKNYMQQFPLNNYRALAKDPEGVTATVQKLLPQGVTGKQNELVARVGEAVKEYLAPRIHQFKKSWRANWTVNGAKVTYDSAENLTQQLMNGAVKTDPGKNLVLQSFQNTKEGIQGFEPIRDLIEALPEKQIQEFWQVWKQGLTSDKLIELQQAGKISPEVVNFAQKMEAIDKFVTGEINKAEVAVGHKPTEWREGHYGLSRLWEGDTRVIVRNDSGQTVAVAGGPNRRAALASAETLVKDNPGWKLGEEFSLSSGDIPKDLSPHAMSPSFILERQDIRGYKWDTKAFTKEEFTDAVENALRARMKYQANLAVDDLLGPARAALQKEDPVAFRMVEARLNDYAGVQSVFGKWQNRVVDQVLGPTLGVNSATKIVQLTNTGLYNFQLGALKMAYPILNALQFVQTVLPETAFLMGRAPAESKAGYYSFFAAGGTTGPVGGMGVLSPLKIMAKSFQEMKAPSAELSSAFNRAVNDRVIDPRLVESYIGESSVAIKDFGKVLKGQSSMVEWLRAVSEFLPAHSERFSRAQAFTTGHMIGRDFLRSRDGGALNADQIYSFAKQFTENTMYLYSASDKPRVFTTPAGSAMGLFKNWMFHYLGSMGEYAQQGFTHNNWAPLLWQTSGTFALGGLAATPLWWAADSFSRMWGGKPAMEMAYEQFGKTGGDAMLLGLPAAITGISLYSAVNSPASNPMRDAGSLFSVVAWDRVKSIGKAGGAAFDNWQATGEHPAHNQGVRELLVRSFAPTTIYRTMASMSEPGQISQLGTGYPQLKDATPMQRVLYSFGFNPTELERGNAIAQELYQTHTKMTAKQKSFGDAWADAEANKDSQQMALIMRQAMVSGLDISQVIKEGLKGLRKRQQDVLQRSVRPQDIGLWKSAIAAQEED